MMHEMMGLGWLGVQLKWAHDRREALRWIIDPRARQIAAEGGSRIPPRKGEYFQDAAIDAPWPLRILGERGVKRLNVSQPWLTPDAPYSLRELRRLFPKAEVNAVVSRPPSAPGRERLIRGKE
jgi:hypothetical protein